MTMSGLAFEKHLRGVLQRRYGKDLQTVSDRDRGDLGCDFLLPGEGVVIQAYGPEEHVYIASGFSSRVKDKISNELRKMSRHGDAIAAMLSGKMKAWWLVIPDDPSPDILQHAGRLKHEFPFEVRVFGIDHFGEDPDRLGYDPDNPEWRQLRREMEALAERSVYGAAELGQLFVEQRCSVILPLDASSDSYVDSSLAMLNEFVRCQGEFDTPRWYKWPAVLFGAFGLGKSSTLQMFASRLAADRSGPCPVYIPLREAVLSKTISIRDAVRDYLASNFGITDFEASFAHRPIVWLFDGFDELNLLDTSDGDWIQARYSELEQFAKRGPLTRVIISSRPILFMRSPGNISTPTPRLELEEFSLSDIEVWIDQWKAVNPLEDTALSPKGLLDRSLYSVVTNPLLLFMVARLIDDELIEPRAYLRSEVYEEFISATERGKFSGEPDIDRFQRRVPKDYRKVLREISLAIFESGSSGLISTDELKAYISRSALDVLHTNSLRSLLVAHFFQEAEGVDSDIAHVEFSHQSFREFLLAERLVEVLDKWVETGKRPDELSAFTVRALDSAELLFLMELICLQNGAWRQKLYAGCVETLEDIFAPGYPSSRSATMVAILCAHIAATIAAFCSQELRQRLGNNLPIRLGQLRNATLVHSRSQPMRSALQGFLSEFAGGVIGPSASTDGLHLETRVMQEVAILNPRANEVILTGSTMTLLYIALKNQTLFLSVGDVGTSFFSGGIVFLGNGTTRFNNCTFHNCRIISGSTEAEVNLSNCREIDTTWVNITVHRKSSKTIIPGSLIEETTELLTGYSKEVACSCFVPWTDVIAERFPEFLEQTFSAEEMEMYRFNPLLRQVAIERE